MTAKEALQFVIDNAPYDNIGPIFADFVFSYGHNLSIETINDLYEQISSLRDSRIDELMGMRRIARERAHWIKSYLEGKVWPTEELAKQNLQPQIDNAQAILDACGLKT